MAFNAGASDVVREYGTQDVPMHIRNAPTKLMKELGYGKGYQYDHDAEGGIALDQTGFPDAMGERVYYEPTDRGLEGQVRRRSSTRLRAARRRRVATRTDDARRDTPRARDLPRTVWLLGAISLVNDAASDMIYPLVPLYLASVLMAGPKALGVIEGIAEAASQLIKLFAGVLADRTGAHALGHRRLCASRASRGR